MCIEEIQSVYDKLFQDKSAEPYVTEVFPKLQSEMPSALKHVEIVTLSSSSIQ